MHVRWTLSKVCLFCHLISLLHGSARELISAFRCRWQLWQSYSSHWQKMLNIRHKTVQKNLTTWQVCIFLQCDDDVLRCYLEIVPWNSTESSKQLIFSGKFYHDLVSVHDAVFPQDLSFGHVTDIAALCVSYISSLCPSPCFSSTAQLSHCSPGYTLAVHCFAWLTVASVFSLTPLPCRRAQHITR